MIEDADTVALGPVPPFRVALVGAGRVGTAIAELLRRRGHVIAGVSSRTSASAERAAEWLGTRAFRLVEKDAPDADVILIGTTDGAIPEVVERLVPIARGGSVAWHVSGSFGIAPMAPLLTRGVLGCAVHPMQACPTVEAALTNLPGTTWGVTTTPGLERWAHRLVAAELSGVAIDIAEEKRPLWHAASITTSTGIAAVMAAGEALLSEIGVPAPHEALRPLINGTITHALGQGGGSHTVTGPLVRGDEDTLSRHRDALRGTADHTLLASYLLVARLLLDRAVATNRIRSTTAARMRALLREMGGGDDDQGPPMP